MRAIHRFLLVLIGAFLPLDFLLLITSHRVKKLKWLQDRRSLDFKHSLKRLLLGIPALLLGVTGCASVVHTPTWGTIGIFIIFIFGGIPIMSSLLVLLLRLLPGKGRPPLIKQKDSHPKLRMSHYIVVTSTCLLFCLIGLLMFKCAFHPFEFGRFSDHLSEYAHITNLTPCNEQPYIVGKVITIDKSTDDEVRNFEWGNKKTRRNEIDYIYFEIPKKLRALNPDEVGTIIWLEWGKDAIARYGVGNEVAVYQIKCEITVIDKARSQVICSKTFFGSCPETPYVLKGKSDRYGSEPTDDIIRFIGSLPHFLSHKNEKH